MVLNDLVASAYTTGRVYIKSDGTPWRPIVHIRDIIGAVLAVLEAPHDAIHNETFNVGRTEENYRIRELAAYRRRNRSWLPDRVRSRRWPGQALLPRQLRQDPPRAAGFPAAVDRPQGCAGTCTTPTAPSA